MRPSAGISILNEGTEWAACSEEILLTYCSRCCLHRYTIFIAEIWGHLGGDCHLECDAVKSGRWLRTCWKNKLPLCPAWKSKYFSSLIFATMYRCNNPTKTPNPKRFLKFDKLRVRCCRNHVGLMTNIKIPRFIGSSKFGNCLGLYAETCRISVSILPPCTIFAVLPLQSFFRLRDLDLSLVVATEYLILKQLIFSERVGFHEWVINSY
jgi:hypothetical protein